VDLSDDWSDLAQSLHRNDFLIVNHHMEA